MEKIRAALMRWYRENRRELPWRETADPYRIWISEIILQQTRVAQGMDYFLRFMERFPGVAELAAAPEDEVMSCWQGLGYYSRARNLHEAARSIVAAGGGFPDTYEGVRALKGVGEYTAAAICSAAYGLPYAAVDGNVYRVLSRLMGVDTPIDTTAGKHEFARLAETLLDRTAPGDFNQAMMDFGAIQCIPKNPDCLSCPLAGSCAAYAEGRVRELPVKIHRVQVTDRYFNYLYVRAGRYTFLNKRTGNDIWRNLYEPPLVETDRELGEEEFYAHPLLRAMMMPGEKAVFRCLQRGVRHVLSHRVIHANFYGVELPPDTSSFASFLKIGEETLDSYPVSRLVSQFFEKKSELFGESGNIVYF